jgi:hypothetical protein
VKLKVGTYHEREHREITRCPSYYAADWEKLETIPGEYWVTLSVEGGFTIPMPKWVLIRIDTTRLAGRLYSGFCGNNFAHTDLEPGQNVGYCIQTYPYMLPKMIADGLVTLDPEFAWLNLKSPRTRFTDIPEFPSTWDEWRALLARNDLREEVGP